MEISYLEKILSDELKTLKMVCQNLEKASIPYMLTGSFAANLYTIPRMTRDIDMIIEILDTDVDKFLEVFERDFYVDRRALIEAIKFQRMFNLIHQKTIVKIDFIILNNSSYHQVEFQRKRQIWLGDTQIWVISPEDLIISKLLWAKDSLSEMQLRDVKNIIEGWKNLDKAYIDEWLQKLHLNAIYEKVGH